MRACLLALTLVLSVVFARTPEALRSPEQVAAHLDLETTQILVMAETLRSKAIAEALRHAAVDRGVKVFVLVSPEHVTEGGSFVPSLAATELIAVRLASFDRTFIVSGTGGDALLMEGDMLARSGVAFDSRGAYAVRDPGVIAARARLFADVWEHAPVYDPILELVPKSPGG